VKRAAVALSGLVIGGALLAPISGLADADTSQTVEALEIDLFDVPSVETLEARGALIGAIDIRVLNIFNPNDPRENSGFYRLADELHVKTRESAVRHQLLFRAGDRIRRQRLSETERLLRSRSYFTNATVRVTHYDEVTNVASLTVTVHDVWTLDPELSVARSGGRSTATGGLVDQNFLGTGSALALTHTRDLDRSSTMLSYADNNLAGSWWRLSAADANNSDGGVRLFDLERPFYSLDSRDAVGGSVSDSVSRVARYSSGVIRDQIDEHHILNQVYYGWSGGLVNGEVSRWLVGVRADIARFGAQPGSVPLAPLGQDRQLVYPWMGWSWIEDRYETATNVDLIGRTEDLNFGRTAYLEVGYSSPSMGGAGHAIPFQLSLQDAWHLPASQLVFGTMSVVGRIQDGSTRNLTATVSGRYFYRPSDWDVVYVGLTGIATDRLDVDQQLLLGGDNGLRGYPVRFQSGHGSVLLTVERRAYTPWFPLRLVRVGFAVFADAGRTFGRDEFGAAPVGVLKDIGLGVRLGNNRSGLGNVLHIDLTHALVAQPGVGGLQLSMSTQQKF
jgi:hypothetical protein